MNCHRTKRNRHKVNDTRGQLIQVVQVILRGGKPDKDRKRKAATASLSYIAKGGGLADPASFSIQPTTGGQRCSSQLTPLKEISSPFKLYKTPRSDAMSCRKTSTSI
ncbi:unnamed protein product [Pleuronectes platessa]|uniref:Uncharacterized protein n=1 Tax=Pleuronectes platessa TaxID=8262 RepID=A0A9N7V5R8_PLEPL|nr:unnamed protein product [Pleuronectes platessa]